MNLISIYESERRMIATAQKIVGIVDPLIKDISPFTEEVTDLKVLQQELVCSIENLKQEFDKVENRGAWGCFVKALENVYCILKELFTSKSTPGGKECESAINNFAENLSLLKISGEEKRTVNTVVHMQKIVEALICDMQVQPSDVLKNAVKALNQATEDIKLEHQGAKQRVSQFRKILQNLECIYSNIVEGKMTSEQKMQVEGSSISHFKRDFITCYKDEFDLYQDRICEQSQNYEEKHQQHHGACSSSYAEKVLSQRASSSQNQGQGGRGT
ncbi:hypothetical protein [Orientia tsutsugamushi]|uniref:hypothetical protein n=1 Tax=Orientia tsutsugamushi TaxID=784 RepID=UPI000D5A28F0|nr:Uncharacterised protein [Orientia tsutsugamushi]